MARSKPGLVRWYLRTTPEVAVNLRDHIEVRESGDEVGFKLPLKVLYPDDDESARSLAGKTVSLWVPKGIEVYHAIKFEPQGGIGLFTTRENNDQASAYFTKVDYSVHFENEECWPLKYPWFDCYYSYIIFGRMVRQIKGTCFFDGLFPFRPGREGRSFRYPKGIHPLDTSK